MSTEIKQKKQKKQHFTAKQDIALLLATQHHGVVSRGSSAVWETIADQLKDQKVVDTTKKLLASRYQILIHAFEGIDHDTDGDANLAVLKGNCDEDTEYTKKVELLKTISANRAKSPKKPTKESKGDQSPAIAPSEPFDAPESPVVAPAAAPKTPKLSKADKAAAKAAAAAAADVAAPAADVAAPAAANADEESDDESSEKKRRSSDDSSEGPRKKTYKTQKERRAELEAKIAEVREQTRQDTIQELFNASALEVPAGCELEAWKFMREGAAMKVRLDKQLENDLVMEKLKLEHAREAGDRAREFEKWKFEQTLAADAQKLAAETAREELLIKLVNHVIELKKK